MKCHYYYCNSAFEIRTKQIPNKMLFLSWLADWCKWGWHLENFYRLQLRPDRRWWSNGERRELQTCKLIPKLLKKKIVNLKDIFCGYIGGKIMSALVKYFVSHINNKIANRSLPISYFIASFHFYLKHSWQCLPFVLFFCCQAILQSDRCGVEWNPDFQSST